MTFLMFRNAVEGVVVKLNYDTNLTVLPLTGKFDEKDSPLFAVEQEDEDRKFTVSEALALGQKLGG